MKKIKLAAILTAALMLFTACGDESTDANGENPVEISLSDSEIKVDGVKVSTDKNSAVYTANDIVYYESGKDFTYGEGDEKDAHTEEEAAAHTVIHITKPGTYSLSGKLSKGQIAIDLGEDAENDDKARVTLILNGVDITCDVAPGVIFYNVYECASDDEETAMMKVNTEKAGANVVIADGTKNTINGSYVARIYKADSVVLNAEGTAVEDADKLHKYDGAFYSRMSMNVNGGEKGDGVLNINAKNEGLDTELHLTINGGNINIVSGNDGINTNEDNVSVTAINGGNLKIKVTGETGEGDGIDSNGWLVINGGSVYAQACAFSADSGIDSDKGIHINGGTVVATGSMLDHIEADGNTYAVFNFAERQKGNVSSLILKDSKGKEVFKVTPENDYSVFIYSATDLKAGTYTLWSDETQLAGAASMMFGGGMPGGRGPRPEGGTPPEGFDPKDFDPEKMRPEFDNGEMPEFDPENMPEDFKDRMPPDGFGGGKRPEGKPGERPKMPDQNPDIPARADMNVEVSTNFEIQEGGNVFSQVKKAS